MDKIISSGNMSTGGWNGSSGGSSEASLTSTYIGYGDSSNKLTGSSDFTWDETGSIMSVATNSTIKSANSLTLSSLVLNLTSGSGNITLTSADNCKLITTGGIYLNALTGSIRCDSGLVSVDSNLTSISSLSSGTTTGYLYKSAENTWGLSTGSGGSAALTAQYVGFGDSSNVMTGSNHLVYDLSNNTLKLLVLDGASTAHIESDYNLTMLASNVLTLTGSNGLDISTNNGNISVSSSNNYNVTVANTITMLASSTFTLESYTGIQIQAFDYSSLGFFGTNPTTRKTLAVISTSSTLSNVITALNQLITILGNNSGSGYGLIAN